MCDAAARVTLGQPSAAGVVMLRAADCLTSWCIDEVVAPIRYLQTFKHAVAWPEKVTDLTAFLSTAPKANSLPLPQNTWRLLALLHYQQRKRWAWDVYQQRLLPFLRGLKKPAVVVEDDDIEPCEGIIPRMPNWAYFLDGNDSHLTHRGTAERIHIDILNGPEDMTDWAFEQFVYANRQRLLACASGGAADPRPSRRRTPCPQQMPRLLPDSTRGAGLVSGHRPRQPTSPSGP